jgi:putative ubiquitin-RnfH superfamily antitoxin RatB of RatAB toxin-antitoxin module
MPRLRVEVVYARADAQQVVALELTAGSRVKDAVNASGLSLPPDATFGRFGQLVRDDAVVRDGDRIEVLRPLAQDPKEARRRRGRRR